ARRPQLRARLMRAQLPSIQKSFRLLFRPSESKPNPPNSRSTPERVSNQAAAPARAPGMLVSEGVPKVPKTPAPSVVFGPDIHVHCPTFGSNFHRSLKVTIEDC